MTALLMSVTGLFFAYAIYIAAQTNRLAGPPDDFLDAGGEIPPWGYIFTGTGIVLAALTLHDHILLSSLYGLQYSHVALGLLLVALTGAVVQKRVWLASRITGLKTLGDLMGSYYGSAALRIYFLSVLFLFGVPLAAYCLAATGSVVHAATEGALPSPLVISITAFFLFLYCVVGGWRGVIYVATSQAVIVVSLIPFIGGFTGIGLDGLAFLSQGIPTADGILGDRIPGVIQFSAGIGLGVPAGGYWTTVAIASFALSLIGVVLSPGFSFLGITTSTRQGFAFQQVWMLGGIAAGLLLLFGPIIATAIAATAPLFSAPSQPLAGLFAALATVNPLVAICFVVLLVASLQLAVAFFTASSANILTIEMISRYVLPEMTGVQRKLAARITLAAIFIGVGLTAIFAPLSAAIFGSLALSLAAQALPAYLGLCWLPWISRSGVLTGLVVGIILVVMTEPLGLITLGALYVELPWGRWPLTIHSAAWGLAFNLAACLLVSLFTRRGAERDHRQRLHDEFARNFPTNFGRPAARNAKWSLTLIWAFLALGPGAIIGNSFFSRPVFIGDGVELGLPSLLVWQIVFWFLGVLNVWWLAYHVRMSVIDVAPRRTTLALGEPPNPLFLRPTPSWIGRFLDRIAGQSVRRAG